MATGPLPRQSARAASTAPGAGSGTPAPGVWAGRPAGGTVWVPLPDGALAGEARATHLALHVVGKAGDGKRRPVDAAHKETLEHDLVEGAVRAATEEAVELRAWAGQHQRRAPARGQPAPTGAHPASRTRAGRARARTPAAIPATPSQPTTPPDALAGERPSSGQGRSGIGNCGGPPPRTYHEYPRVRARTAAAAP